MATTDHPTTDAPAAVPELRNAGTAPATRRKLFLNLPVADLQRTIRFFEALGFTFDPHFTDAKATCMLVGDDAYCMLLTRPFFETFSGRPVGDPVAQPYLSLALALDARADVDAMVERAIAHGGEAAGEAMDHGFMYQRGFRDLDGYHWDPFWMDPAAIPG